MGRAVDVAFGDKLRHRRLQAGLSQVTVSERAARHGVKASQGHIADIEAGRYIPTDETRRALAAALEMTEAEMESLYLEARLEELGLDDPAFTLLFKDVPNMTPEEKQSLLRVYFEDILPARRRRETRKL